MKLVGNIDGVEISFNFYPPNTFKSMIPKQLDGTYIVQLKALDDAGNETNFSDIFMYLDFQKMRFKVLDESFKYIQNGENYGYVSVNNKFNIKEITNKYTAEFTSNNYSYRELVI